MNNVIYLSRPDDLYLNQELEAAEAEIIQVKKFLALRDSERQELLDELENSKKQLRSIVRSISKIYTAL